MVILDCEDDPPTGWAFDATGTRLALGGWGGARIFETATGRALWEGMFDPEHEEPGIAEVLAFGPEGRLLACTGHHTGASGSNDVYLLAPEAGEVNGLEYAADAQSRGDYGDCEAACFSPDGRIAAAVSSAGIHLWPLAELSKPRCVKLPRDLRTKDGYTWSGSDGTALVLLPGARAALVFADHVLVAELEQGTFSVVAEAPGDIRLGDMLAVRPDGSLLVTENEWLRRGENRRLWRLPAGGKALCEGPALPGRPVWLSPDGRAALCEDEDGGLLEVNLESETSTALPRPELPADGGDLRGLAASGDGRVLLYGTDPEDVLVRVVVTHRAPG
ncbi:WD40 repeat domain-containing protein [Polyangium aurulentum]|uniref:WD40 repeat domain-containing protein n=1 Tax=Polyangium aurulentum TaxID=2567896 RepID=UPI0010ADF30A|nr:hypothetical protein [Polyangium aurulentum]UQA60651.1 hypothetical protein E8A73_009310 [Polyangium aurulentum]